MMTKTDKPVQVVWRRERDGRAWAQETVAQHHYLGTKVDTRTSFEVYEVWVTGERVGVMMWGRPEATRLYPFYGSVDDVAVGRAAVTRWQILNLSRVWLSPRVQDGGDLYREDVLPGFRDRNGRFRSTLASTVVGLGCERVVGDYLMAHPPIFLDEPYHIRYLISYCDTGRHRATLYRASGFDLLRTNGRGIQTWRRAARPLTAAEDARIQDLSHHDTRARTYRAARTPQAVQLPLTTVMGGML